MKKLLTVLLVLLVFVGIVGFVGIYLPYKNIRVKANALMASANQLKPDIQKNDMDVIENRMNDIAAKYADFEKASQAVYWTSFIPYGADYKRGVEAGHYMVKAGVEAVQDIKPYADLIGFQKGKASFVDQSSEDRLHTAVLTLDKLTGKIDGISDDIHQAELRLNQIDPNRYPEKIGKTVVRARLVSAKQQFDGINSLLVDAKPLVKALPQMLGKDKEMTYLILNQNEYEERPSGGFLTYYSVFKVKDGKITVDKSNDIYELDNSISHHPAAPYLISKYHINVPTFNIRDSNLSPDIPTTVDSFMSLYKDSSEKVNYDGIIFVDSKILVDMINIFGPTNANGVTFSDEPNKACAGCPNVIYQLFDIVDRPVGYVKVDRKGILGSLMRELLYKALGFPPKQYWGRLFQTMLTNMNEKHIMFYFKDPNLQSAVESINFAGRVRDYNGDYLNVNNANFAGAKSDLFVQKIITSKTTFTGGTVNREVTLDYRNPHPASDCNLERGGLCLNAPLRNLIRVYVPQGSKLVSFKGSSTQVRTYDELGKTVFEGFLTVPTQGKAQAVVTYTLPSSISNNNYSIMVQKQPGEETEQLKVDVDNKKLYDGIFDTDKVLK